MQKRRKKSKCRTEMNELEKLKIFYDYQIMLIQKYGGISRYYFDLLSSINKTGEAHADAYSIGNRSIYFKEYFNRFSERFLPGFGKLNRFVASQKRDGSNLYQGVQSYRLGANTGVRSSEFY